MPFDTDKIIAVVEKLKIARQQVALLEDEIRRIVIEQDGSLTQSDNMAVLTSAGDSIPNRISRQLKWQRKMIAEGRCMICGQPAYGGGSKCKIHIYKSRLRSRGRNGSQPHKPGAPGRPSKYENLENLK
jgi:hypothetical protein